MRCCEYTHFVVGQKSSGPGRVARFTASGCRCVQTAVLTGTQRERLTVHGHAHHEFSGVRALVHPIVQREILKKLVVVL